MSHEHDPVHESAAIEAARREGYAEALRDMREAVGRMPSHDGRVGLIAFYCELGLLEAAAPPAPSSTPDWRCGFCDEPAVGRSRVPTCPAHEQWHPSHHVDLSEARQLLKLAQPMLARCGDDGMSLSDGLVRFLARRGGGLATYPDFIAVFAPPPAGAPMTLWTGTPGRLPEGATLTANHNPPDAARAAAFAPPPADVICDFPQSPSAQAWIDSGYQEPATAEAPKEEYESPQVVDLMEALQAGLKTKSAAAKCATCGGSKVICVGHNDGGGEWNDPCPECSRGTGKASR